MNIGTIYKTAMLKVAEGDIDSKGGKSVAAKAGDYLKGFNGVDAAVGGGSALLTSILTRKQKPGLRLLYSLLAGLGGAGVSRGSRDLYSAIMARREAKKNYYPKTPDMGNDRLNELAAMGFPFADTPEVKIDQKSIDRLAREAANIDDLKNGIPYNPDRLKGADKVDPLVEQPYHPENPQKAPKQTLVQRLQSKGSIPSDSELGLDM